MMPNWRQDQWVVMVTLFLTHLSNGMCVSLQAPFYPNEAEKKGASAAQYGLVFGIFELTVFIVSPFTGRILPKVLIQGKQRKLIELTLTTLGGVNPINRAGLQNVA